jgi:MFS-type transporter involved in bile tolerance (Atg22 family)
MATTIPIWALVSLTTIAEAFCAASIFGVALGLSGSAVRSAWSRMIPISCESEFASYFAIADRLAAFIGPIIVIAVNESTCSYRLATFAVVGFLVLGAIGVLLVDFNRSHAAAKLAPPR